MRGKNKYIRIWLWIGLMMVFFQVVLGGITRLSDAGLSITEWDLVKGVIPPLTQDDWIQAFEKYKSLAFRQYDMLHSDMSLGEFKWIYFLEWFHRLWARLMGFVFILPLILFWWKGWISNKLWKQLGLIFFVASLAGVFGWIMVASGLNTDKRTWVSAYKLIIHLSLASLLFGLIYWTILGLDTSKQRNEAMYGPYRKSNYILLLFAVQLLFGGLMAGMRAGIIFPYYPLWIKPEMTWIALNQKINLIDFVHYEPAVAIKAWVQIIHRLLPLVLFYLFFKLLKETKPYSGLYHRVAVVAFSAMLMQYLLGILTVVLSKAGVPILWGVMHQAMALFLLLTILHMRFKYKFI